MGKIRHRVEYGRRWEVLYVRTYGDTVVDRFAALEQEFKAFGPNARWQTCRVLRWKAPRYASSQREIDVRSACPHYRIALSLVLPVRPCLDTLVGTLVGSAWLLGLVSEIRLVFHGPRASRDRGIIHWKHIRDAVGAGPMTLPPLPDYAIELAVWYASKPAAFWDARMLNTPLRGCTSLLNYALVSYFGTDDPLALHYKMGL